jgi:hypothetical protein
MDLGDCQWVLRKKASKKKNAASSKRKEPLGFTEPERFLPIQSKEPLFADKGDFCNKAAERRCYSTDR